MIRTESSSRGTTSSGADPALVRAELTRLLKSDHFKNSKRCQTLLTYVVEETLADHGDQLKERILGVNVFGRPADYDTSEDPVVRNAAIEVRKRLAQFYIESGRDAAIRIDLNTGTYVPEFRSQQKVVGPAAPVAPVVPERAPIEPRRRNGWILPAAAVFVLAFASVVGIRLLQRSGDHNTAADSTSRRLADGATVPNVPADAGGDGAIRILAGNQQKGPYIDRFGEQWLPDAYFSGGESKSANTNLIFPPPDPALFRTLRTGTFAYDIPLKENQNYELRLYFVEPQFHYGNRVAGDGENSRLFQVRANGKVILDNFDIIEDAGFSSTTVRAFNDIVAASDGKLHLQFVTQREQPVVSAIELLPTAIHAIPPVRIHTAATEYRDQSGKKWSPDNFYVGGQLFDSGAQVTDNPDPDLFAAARFGNFTYGIPVPAGRYSLTLYFAETWFRVPGQRVFDVNCNGVSLIRGLDILQQAGFAHLYRKTFHGLEPNGQGKLQISFSPRTNYATVRAIEVMSE